MISRLERLELTWHSPSSTIFRSILVPTEIKFLLTG